MTALRWRRRSWVASLLALPLLGASRRDWRRVRRRAATFTDLGDVVQYSTRLPELLPLDDPEVVAALESGFRVHLSFDVIVVATADGSVAGRVSRQVRIKNDLWRGGYVVSNLVGNAWRARRFPTLDAAVADATRLRRLTVAEVVNLRRGGPSYVAIVRGLRNPLGTSEGGRRRGHGRGRERGSRWFGRLVEFLADDGPEAEAVVEVRSHPFYLVERGS